MDAALFAKMISDKLITDLKKMGYKYPQADMKEFTGLLKQEFYRPIPLRDFYGHPLVYLDNITQVRLSAAKIFLSPQSGTQLYGIQAMENEILAYQVRKKGKSLKGCIAALLKWSFANQIPVGQDILKEAGVKAGRVTLGIPGMARAKKIITEYYMGK